MDFFAPDIIPRTRASRPFSSVRSDWPVQPVVPCNTSSLSSITCRVLVQESLSSRLVLRCGYINGVACPVPFCLSRNPLSTPHGRHSNPRGPCSCIFLLDGRLCDMGFLSATLGLFPCSLCWNLTRPRLGWDVLRSPNMTVHIKPFGSHPWKEKGLRGRGGVGAFELEIMVSRLGRGKTSRPSSFFSYDYCTTLSACLAVCSLGTQDLALLSDSSPLSPAFHPRNHNASLMV